jgi:hypothetical protein
MSDLATALAMWALANLLVVWLGARAGSARRSASAHRREERERCRAIQAARRHAHHS